MKTKQKVHSDEDFSDNTNTSSEEDNTSAEEDVSQTNKRKPETNGTKAKIKKQKVNNDASVWSCLDGKEDHSKLFCEQVRGLLKENRMPFTVKANFDKWCEKVLRFLRNDIQDYPDVLQSKINVSNGLHKYINKKYSLPYQTNEDLNIQFLKPAGISKLSNFSFDTGITEFEFKVVVHMPRAMFRKRDYLNNIYFIRKYYYLLYLEYELKRGKISEKSSISSHYNNNRYLNVLRIHFPSAENIYISIFVCPEENSFKLSRFIPQTNNMKFESETLKETLKRVKKSESFDEGLSPYYNMSILHDMTLHLNDKFYESTFHDCNDFIAAYNALRIFLHKRQLRNVIGGITDEILLYLLAYLFHKNDFVKHQSPYQIVTQFFHSINSMDWKKEAIHLSQPESISVEEYRKHFDFVWIDKSGYYDVAAFISTEVYAKLKEQAGITLKCLKNGLF